MKLDRSLGLTSVVSISIGAMIGGGLFVLPGMAAAISGPSLWLAYVLAGLLVIPAALAKAELSTAMPAAGGTYLFIERSLGPFAGTVAGVGASLTLLLKACFALIGLGGYLLLLVPLDSQAADAGQRSIALGVLALVTVLNLLGVKRVGRVQTWLVGASLAVLFLLSAVGASALRGPLLTPQFPAGAAGLFAATGFIFVSYAGVTNIAAVAEEVRDPSRNIPRGILISLGIMGSLYALVALVLVGVVPYHSMRSDVTPIATLARALGGSLLAAIVAVVASLALASMANAGLLAGSRFPFAMSRDRLLPGWLGRVSPGLLTPIGAILASSLAMATALTALDVVKIAKLASGFQIFIFCLENFSLIVFRESGASWYRPTFRVPLYPWVPLLGIAGGLALILSLGTVAAGGIALFSVLAAIWHGLYGKSRARRRGLLQQVWKRADLLAPAGLVVDDVPIPEAKAVVALFGGERSPEALVEIGASLRPTPADRIDVLYMRELPAQTELAGALIEDDRIAAVRRRVLALASAAQLDVSFETIVTHDARKALYHQAREAHCQWVIVGHRRRRNAAFVHRPLEWLLHHLHCDVAVFRDAGVRVYRRILVMAHPGPHDALVARTADELARIHGADLTFIDVLAEREPEARGRQIAAYHDELRQMCRASSASRVLRADDQVEAIVHASVGYDMLVIAAGEERPLRNIFFPTTNDRIANRALCSVLLLRTPRQQTHQTVERMAESTPAFDLHAALARRALLAQLSISTKDELIACIAGAFAKELGLPLERVEAAFLARERTQNTGLGQGLALPHATLPEAPRTMLGIFTTAEPVEYQAVDRKPVRVCLATVGPPAERQIHLRMLAALSKLLLETELGEGLARARYPQELERALQLAKQRHSTSERR
ncbi:MAG: amino acid permease [Acidobacteriota bacterium]|nr:MAG: amino acid permease [Acidobacteriota bacterium]